MNEQLIALQIKNEEQQLAIRQLWSSYQECSNRLVTLGKKKVSKFDPIINRIFPFLLNYLDWKSLMNIRLLHRKGNIFIMNQAEQLIERLDAEMVTLRIPLFVFDISDASRQFRLQLQKMHYFANKGHKSLRPGPQPYDTKYFKIQAPNQVLAGYIYAMQQAHKLSHALYMKYTAECHRQKNVKTREGLKKLLKSMIRHQ